MNPLSLFSRVRACTSPTDIHSKDMSGGWGGGGRCGSVGANLKYVNYVAVPMEGQFYGTFLRCTGSSIDCVLTEKSVVCSWTDMVKW